MNESHLLDLHQHLDALVGGKEGVTTHQLQTVGEG